MKYIATIFFAMIASVAAFMPSPLASTPSNSALYAAKAGEESGDKKMAYVPAGLTREEYAAILKKDEEKKNKKLSYKGGTGETLEEFQEKSTDGYRVKHRFPKFKFSGWFQDE